MRRIGHQRVQRVVPVHQPPLATVRLVARLGRLPAFHLLLALGFFVGRAHIKLRALVIGAYRAGAQQRAQRQRDGAARKTGEDKRLGSDHVGSMEAEASLRRPRPRAAHRRNRSR
ncbi:hypothetical protein D3C81_1926460 [compost metagenome]